MITWDVDAVYIALIVTDDEHEHAAAAAWNGDGAQLAFEMSVNAVPVYHVALQCRLR